MKKFLATLSVLALFSGCALSQTDKEAQAATKIVEETQIILFTAVNNPSYKVSVASKNDFETAVFLDANGKKHILKNDVSANGIRLTNSEGIDLIFRKGVGYLKTSKNAKEIELRYTE